MEKIIEKYNKKIPGFQKIYPISFIDIEIIKEIKEIFKKLNIDNLVKILDEYKIIEDEKIFEKLLEWNANFKSLENNEGENQEFKKIFIEISNELKLDSRIIQAIKIIDEYNIFKQKMVYKIIINPNEKEGFNTNFIIEFLSQEERDKEIVNLKSKLESYNVVFL